MSLLWVVPFLIGHAGACGIVDGDRILGRDLRKADARYSALPGDLVAGFSPMPGAQRILDRRVLGSIARRHGIDVEGLTPLCFERPTETLSAAKLQPVLQRVLGAVVKLEIVDFSRYPVPTGELMFSIRDLIQPPAAVPDAAVIWRGNLRYGERSTAAVWAKVRVLKFERWVETEKPIPAHTAIRADQITVKSGWRFPFAIPMLTELDTVIGKMPVQTLKPGQMVLPTILELAREVERGETVDVEVASGRVSLRFTARAETSARSNEAVVVFQADTGRRYRGRVQGKGKVLIDADSKRKADLVGRQPDTAGFREPVNGRRQAEEVQGGRAGSTGPVPD